VEATVGNAAGPRRMVLERAEFSCDPRALRGNLARIDGLIRETHPAIRRRVGLMFGQLVAQWVARFPGEPMAVDVELIADAVRLSTGGVSRRLDEADWANLVTDSIADLVDGWGFDRRHAGDAWFEFHDPRPASTPRFTR
jgi:hypothetical protein